MKRKILRFLIFIGCVLFLKSYALEIRQISGHSMEPALSDGQFVVIWKLAYGIPLPATNRYLCRWKMPQAGDTVLYHIDGRYVVKRCVKTENAALHFITAPQEAQGDYAALRLDNRTVALNRVQFRNLGGFLPENEQRVPDGFILALGDNAAQSRDSRDYGFVSVDSICGRLLWN
ncbi:signal peptidase I [Treponema vincentii]|uniref:signal peptidase I n=1 Tax=Treponema vincentii TaxID=69710 RepID=UPI003D8FB0D4